jgi:hypothetical protein
VYVLLVSISSLYNKVKHTYGVEVGAGSYYFSIKCEVFYSFIFFFKLIS